MQTHWTLDDAQKRFDEVVNAACTGTPQVVTLEGTPSVVVLAAGDYQRLVAQENSSSFCRLLLAMPQDDSEISHGELQLREVAF